MVKNNFNCYYYRNYQLLLRIGCIALLVIYLTLCCQTMVYSSPLSGLMTSAKGFTGTLYNVAKVLCPLCIVIDGIAIFFTRDDRGLKLELKILAGIIIGFIVIYLAANKPDEIISFFEQIANGSYTAETAN